MSSWTKISYERIITGDALLLSVHVLTPRRGPGVRQERVARVLSYRAGELLLEWISVHGSPTDAPRPHTTSWMTGREIGLAEPRYRPDQSPTDRTHAAGEVFMLGLLKTACGGDPARLAQCVDPTQRVPLTVGLEAAKAVLAGGRPVREWMIRQCDGRASVTVSIDHDTTESDADVAAIMRAIPGVVVRDVRYRGKGD